MPFTPYHFGPSGFIGLIFRKWIDLPVFVLANVIVDIEVLFADSWPKHKYAHTLLIGTAVGVVWALAAYPLRPFFKKVMQIIRIPYKTGFWKMIISGILGVWLHVLTDGIYHWDVQMFWPGKSKLLWRLLSQGQVKAICIAFFVTAVIVYATTVLPYIKQNKAEKVFQESN
jgi:membrane-bound metal-dependent hydrolase YbcI (DUF457 family)